MYLSTYPASPIVLDVLGTADADEIRAVAHRYEPETEEVFFFRTSVGALFGVRRSDGGRLAIKVNKLFRDPGYFAEVQRPQEALVAAGFPAPRPVRRDVRAAAAARVPAAGGSALADAAQRVVRLEATAAGAEWIDEIGRAAFAGREVCGLEVVGHTDWSAMGG